MAGEKSRVASVEGKLIRKIRDATSPSSRHWPSLNLGIGDDAGLLRPKPEHETILTCDWFLEGTHFLRDKHPPDAVGWKSLARALSDVAAMGGEPRCFLLSLAFPQSHTGRWLAEFLRGLCRGALKFKCPLAGGDTTQYGQILINVTAIGEVRKGQAVLRSGGRPGDLVFVSGRLGEAELGLRQLRAMRKANARDAAVRKHLYPEPRLTLGRRLTSSRIATAMMDLSDGLSSDLPRLCAASRVGARIYTGKLPTVTAESAAFPVHKRNAPELLDLALNGGDDYELLFTVSPRKAHYLPPSFEGILLTNIGEITRERSLTLVSEDGREHPLHARGWDPFGK